MRGVLPIVVLGLLLSVEARADTRHHPPDPWGWKALAARHHARVVRPNNPGSAEDPGYYAANPLARVMVLQECAHRGPPPRPSRMMCLAAGAPG